MSTQKIAPLPNLIKEKFDKKIGNGKNAKIKKKKRVFMNTNKLKQLIFNTLKQDERLWNKDKTELNQTLLLDLVEKIDETVIDLLLQEKDLRDKFFVKINKKFPSDRGVASQSDDGVRKFSKPTIFGFYFMEENKADNFGPLMQNRIGLTAKK